MASLESCLPTPPPCPGALQPAMAMTDAALGLGGHVEATETCAAFYYKWVAGIDPPYDDGHPHFRLVAFACGDPHKASWWTVADIRGAAHSPANSVSSHLTSTPLPRRWLTLLRWSVGPTSSTGRSSPSRAQRSSTRTSPPVPIATCPLRFVEGSPPTVHIITSNPTGDYSFSEVAAEAVPATFEECVKIGYLTNP